MLIVALLCAGPLAAQTAELLGPDLEPRRVTLRSFSPDGVGVIDAQGEALTIPADEVLRLTLSHEPTRVAEDLAIFRLRDGQVLVGNWHGAGADGESLAFSFNGDDRMDVPLDDLLSVSLVPEKAGPASDDDTDRLTLTNGETLSGFVDAVGDGKVAFELDGTDQLIELPMQRIHAMSIANRPKPAEPEPGLARVMTYNQTTLLIRDAVMKQQDSGEWALQGASVLGFGPKTHAVPLSTLRTIEPLSGGRYRLERLTAQEMELIGGGEVFGVPMPPRVREDGAIAMHAPCVVGFDLPKGAARLALTASLDLGPDLPGHRRALAGCELVVYDGDKPVGGCTLTPDAEPQRLNLPLGSGDLRIELKPGVNGPVLDRVLLTDSELLFNQ